MPASDPGAVAAGGRPIRAGPIYALLAGPMRLPMKIAQIAPLSESCPPKLYGGTERIVSYLTEELVRLGHDVTLFASGDSVTTADLVRCSDMALRRSEEHTSELQSLMRLSYAVF